MAAESTLDSEVRSLVIVAAMAAVMHWIVARRQQTKMETPPLRGVALHCRFIIFRDVVVVASNK